MKSLSEILLVEVLTGETYNKMLLKTSGMKAIVDAIVNRRPITFMYTGPAQGPEKVLKGNRKKVEPVAIGLTNKNKMAIRAWVPSPNVSKKGLEQNQWRTFLLSRMSNIKIDLDSNYEGPKPGFNPDEKQDGNAYWPLIKIYASTDFSAEPKKPRKQRKPTPKPTTVPTAEPEVTPTEPTPQAQAEPTPVEPQVQPTAAAPEVQPTQPTPQVEPTPTEPTTEPAATELPQPKPKTKPSKEPPRLNGTKPTPEPEVPGDENPEEEENNQLNESINRIKRLMFL
jgi:hypothetical protein